MKIRTARCTEARSMKIRTGSRTEARTMERKPVSRTEVRVMERRPVRRTERRRKKPEKRAVPVLERKQGSAWLWQLSSVWWPEQSSRG